MGDCIGDGQKLTSHSCKCTCLSFLAKRGVSIEDRLTLGYHSNKMRMALTYSRDSAARPLAILSHVLQEIRLQIFEPDNTRSGRLNPGAKPLEQVWSEPVELEERDLNASGVESAKGTESCLSDTRSWEQLSEPAQQVEPVAEEGHVTTDSSDESDGEQHAWGPVVGHYVITLPENKLLWKNQNSKMFHLSHAEHERVLCGRRISGSFGRHEGAVRFDSAKCRQCFRLKDS